MKRPHIVFDKPPSAGSHGLRRSSALAAYQRVRVFLERATDCDGACGFDLKAPRSLDDEVRAMFPTGGSWDAGRELTWSGGYRARASDLQVRVSLDQLEAMIGRLASTGQLSAIVRFDFLLCHPRTRERLPYGDADFDESPEPWSKVTLFLEEGGANHISLVMTFPYAEITEEIVAVNDAAVETMGITLSPAHWLRVTPPRRGGKIGKRRRIGFDRNAWVTAPPADDDTALLAQVVADLDSDGPRQVYADVLIARGDARGTFINVQCELARLGPDADPARRAALEALEARLLRVHGKQWGRVPAKLRATLRRGFIEHIRVDSAWMYAGAIEALRAVAPTVTALSIRYLVGRVEIEGLARACQLLPLRGLSLTAEAGVLDLLARAGVLAPLHHLAVECWEPAVAKELVRVLCDGAELPFLTTLALSGKALADRPSWILPPFSGAGVEQIAESSRLPRLARLIVERSAVDADELDELQRQFPIVELVTR